MTESKNKGKKKLNWTKAQIYGLWGTAIVLTAFWTGVYFGGQGILAGQAKENQVKTQAVEAYKASLTESKISQ